jgi:hypothetical protein
VGVIFVFVTAMKHSASFLSLVFFGAFFISGCDLAQPKNRGQGEPPAPPIEEPQQVVEVPPPPPVKEPDPADNNNTVMVTAAPGMSGKGNYGTPTGNNPMEIITVPISVMFRTQDRVILQQVDYAMNLYKAEHGNAPASHAEFWERIIVANNLQPNQSGANKNRLPQLPPGQEYVYDPKDGVLKIRKPKDVP